ncbi:Transcription factor spt8 [Ascosphaera aggregata]|nr:Transcription factor spt8 [Ascosphaera aggregata]
MAALDEDDDDRDLAGSQDELSDNDNDNDNDNDLDDAVPGQDEMELDGDVDQEAAEQGSPDSSMVSESQRDHDRGGQTPATTAAGQQLNGVESLDLYTQLHPPVRPEALTATTYDIAPTIAAPHSCSVNALTATADMRWVFTGGFDGYVRKYNWVDTINGKIMLTVAQRHPFVDSVIKAGALMTYWENMEGANMMPIYSLAAQSEGMWLLTGLQNGNIRLQMLRHEETREIACLKQHTSAVSVIQLTGDEQSALSGGWDKKIMDWDLNTGQPRRIYDSLASQISSIEIRPESSLPIPRHDLKAQVSDTLSSNNADVKKESTAFQDNDDVIQGNGEVGVDTGSPADSLFSGGGDSLFGDVDAIGETDDMFGDSAFTDALTGGLNNAETPKQEETPGDRGAAERQSPVATITAKPATTENDIIDPVDSHDDLWGSPGPPPNVNGDSLPHAEEPLFRRASSPVHDAPHDSSITSDHTFLSASIDGNLRIWDRRQLEPVSRIQPKLAPPWCMNACWSPDGNYIYAGRRNGTVEEYSLHKNLKEPTRTFRFPQGSGAVTAVKAMPNGRHLICASHDILRLYDTQADLSSKHTTVPFLIVPGHRTGVVSQLYVDRACRFMLSAGGNRGWEGITTEVLLGYEITPMQQ